MRTMKYFARERKVQNDSIFTTDKTVVLEKKTTVVLEKKLLLCCKLIFLSFFPLNRVNFIEKVK